jgi:hypothetical protein
MPRSLTAADAVILLTIPLLYPTPQQLQGFATDNVFDVEPVNSAELQMGVDGKMSAGWIPFMTPWGVYLQADSESNDLFENWNNAQNIAREIYYCNGLVTLKSTGRKYTMTKGALTTIPVMPNANKILQARKWTVTWEKIEPAAI